MTAESVGYVCFVFGVMLLGTAGVMLAEQATIVGEVATQSQGLSLGDLVQRDLNRIVGLFH